MDMAPIAVAAKSVLIFIRVLQFFYILIRPAGANEQTVIKNEADAFEAEPRDFAAIRATKKDQSSCIPRQDADPQQTDVLRVDKRARQCLTLCCEPRIARGNVTCTVRGHSTGYSRKDTF